ncbi:unnamed protein product [Schistosoma rodhaini]|uniref:Uncharacterized protein n=1 Tax=Schistosoma mansoni TaxID=6183 RepID=G4VLB4_SCHMA|nr:hypothetical protein Smp_074280 [Schistosoma mansoni]CAH8619705.1 unnamed protein product [Schistosoma rodhaini]|eukprot:XP_018652868.1 hypothetical protein Smp_074280 [Schistosoma mansoni]
MVQVSQIEAYRSLKDKAESFNLLCIVESIIGGLILEQPKNPIEYIKNRLIDTKHIQENGKIHNELYTWLHHPLLDSSKSLTNDEHHQFLKSCFYHRIKCLQGDKLPLEHTSENESNNTEITNPLFSLTELYLNP